MKTGNIQKILSLLVQMNTRDVLLLLQIAERMAKDKRDEDA